MWRPAFVFVERRVACVRGLARRFWQGSTDHRGVPGSPGRVVTLEASPDATCWGVAYRVAEGDRDAVLTRLDHREQGGYTRLTLPLLDPGGEAFAVGLTYVATQENPNWLGPAPLEAIAEVVRRAEGPSGRNVEYVVELARSLRAMGADDSHVFALASLLDSELSPGGGHRSP